MTPNENYIGKDQLTEDKPAIYEALGEDSPLGQKMRLALQAFTDDTPIFDRIRKLEAVRDEHEVQERAKQYRQVEGLTPPEERNTCPHCGGSITPPAYEVG